MRRKLNEFKLIIVIITFLFYSCEKPKRDGAVLSSYFAKIGDTVNIIFNSDSANIIIDKNQNIYFKYYYFSSKGSKLGEKSLEIVDERGSLVIPQNSAYLYGYFYTENKVSPQKYHIHVVNEDNIPVKNTFKQKRRDKDYLGKELGNYPNELYAYREYLIGVAENYYTGKGDSAKIQEVIKTYEPIILRNYSKENPSDLSTLATFQAFKKDFHAAEHTIKQLASKYPNSYELVNAQLAFSFAEHLMTKGHAPKVSDDLETYLLTTTTTESSISTYALSWMTSGPRYLTDIPQAKDSLFSDSQIIEALAYRQKIEPDNIHILRAMTNIQLRLLDFRKAEKYARRYLNAQKSGMSQHYTPLNYDSFGYVSKELGTAYGYNLLATVKEKEGQKKRAINYLDSAKASIEKHLSSDKDKSFFQFLEKRKSILLSELNRPQEALSSYESLYREFRDDNLWDSVQVLFERHPELGDFKTYQRNLRTELGMKAEVLPKAPDFSALATDGNTYNLADWQGSVVVLNFWGSYCLPCARELPELNALQRAFANEDVLFLGPTKDKTIGIERFETRQPEGFSFPSVPEAQELFDAFEIRLVPTQIIINQAGEIIHRQEGAVEGSVEELGDVIQRALDQDS